MEVVFAQQFTAAECTEKKKISMTEVGLDRYLGTSIRESAKIAHIYEIEQPNTKTSLVILESHH